MVISNSLMLLMLLMALVFSFIKILREYERGVIFQLGRFWKVKGPGLIIIIPGIQKMVKVSLRTVVMDVPPQDIITRDNVTVKVNAVLYFRVIDPEKAIIKVEDYLYATSQISQTTLRSILGQKELDDLLAKRDDINMALQKVIDQSTEPWGIKVSSVEVKNVDIPQDMQKVIAKQAQAERERRSKVINAEGELQASIKLSEAADIIGKHPPALQLRFLQTLSDIGMQQNTTTIFPIPMDLIEPFLKQRLKDEKGDNQL
ncbi:MAG: slipin family protein [Nitrospinae bacterium]|nr:slipin family protein [Nitrospinota bacterium]